MKKIFFYLLLFCFISSKNLYSFMWQEFNIDSLNSCHPKVKFVLIIDDIGKSLNNAIKFWEINPNITLSVLPYFKDARKISIYAQIHHLPIMLHFPMEPYNKKFNFKKYYLTTEMTHKKFDKTINFVLKKVPYFEGINNHMGSELTSNYRCMKWFFEKIKDLNKFFIDSRTSKTSIAAKVADDFGIHVGVRDIFIDNDKNEKKILIQLEKLYLIAKTRGFAIGIGHPYPETYNAIKKFLTLKKNIKILSAKEGINQFYEFEKLLVLKREENENSRY